MRAQAAEHWIKTLHLQPHPEGGFYKETYRSTERIVYSVLPRRFTGDRNFSTAIYFLLRAQDRSLFHRIKSDELWHFYAGNTLLIYVLDENGLTTHHLGNDIERGESLQMVIPANTWFGALVIPGGEYTLAGCTVAPGFDFQDFEFADQQQLLKTFPAHSDIIKKLSK